MTRLILLCSLFLFPCGLFCQADTARKELLTLPQHDTKKVLRYNDSLVRDWGSCEDWTDLAKKDAASGILAIKSFGLRREIHYADGYTRYSTWDFLTLDYGIIDMDEGCMVNGDYECYNQYMDSLIRAKFGNDVYARCAAKADSLTKKGMIAKGELFPGGDTALTAFFKSHFPASPDFCDSTTGVINIDFYVDQQGKMSYTRIDDGLCYKLDSTLVDIALQLPRWQPAVNRLNEKMYVRSAIGVKIVNGEIGRAWVYRHRPVDPE